MLGVHEVPGERMTLGLLCGFLYHYGLMTWHQIPLEASDKVKLSKPSFSFPEFFRVRLLGFLHR
jgi:hypothetical protein